MSDLTLLYYTANRIAPGFAAAVRQELLRSTASQHDIVCVSHDKPVEFGRWRHVVHGAPFSIPRVYRNILTAARLAQTPWVACCEDDTLYTREHFRYRPAPDVFAYNEQRVVITRRLSADGRRREAFYYYRPRTQMAMAICSRDLLVAALEERFRAHPHPPEDTDVAKRAGWGEPGRYERNLGLPPRKIERFKWTDDPNVTFNHSESLMGRRRVQVEDTLYDAVEPWGKADALWRRIHG